MENVDLFKPLRDIQFVDRDMVKPNDYNPNKVLEKEFEAVNAEHPNKWLLLSYRCASGLYDY